MYKQTEERWFRGYDIIFTALGGKKTKTYGSTSSERPINVNDKRFLFKSTQDYANLSPQEKEKQTQQMKHYYRNAINTLFRGKNILGRDM